MLDQVARGVVLYLDRRRARFPRFFFLSDEELLGVLSISKNIESINKYLPKLFDSVAALKLNADGHVFAIETTEGAEITLPHPVVPAGLADVWLDALVISTRDAMRQATKQAVRGQFRQAYQQWVLAFAAQAVQTAAQVRVSHQRLNGMGKALWY